MSVKINSKVSNAMVREKPQRIDPKFPQKWFILSKHRGKDRGRASGRSGLVGTFLIKIEQEKGGGRIIRATEMGERAP